MSDPCHDVMTNDYSAYSDELVGARLLHGVYDDAMSPEVSQRPLTGSPHNFLPCRAHGVQNCGSITPTSPSAVRLLSPISNHPRELTRMDGSHLHVYAPRVPHATIEKQLPEQEHCGQTCPTPHSPPREPLRKQDANRDGEPLYIENELHAPLQGPREPAASVLAILPQDESSYITMFSHPDFLDTCGKPPNTTMLENLQQVSGALAAATCTSTTPTTGPARPQQPLLPPQSGSARADAFPALESDFTPRAPAVTATDSAEDPRDAGSPFAPINLTATFADSGRL